MQELSIMRQAPPARPWLRAAMIVQQLYQRQQAADVLLPLPSLETAQKHRRRLRWCLDQRFPAAARYCREALCDSLQSVSQQLTLQLDLLRKPLPVVPSLSLLYQELASLENEFELVELDLRRRQIAVTTERIVLEDTDLGPFEIRLLLDQLHQPSPYTVNALDSNLSTSRNPHPHVQGVSLCEGDGKQAISTALKEGLIGEFFVLVRQVLRTYNDGSAYRRLDEWDGIECSACGDTVGAEDSYSCDTCHISLCEDCEYCCTCCHSSICYDCSKTCSLCENRICSGCSAVCPDCDNRFCRDCMPQERCENCLNTPEDESHEENAPEASSDEEILPDSPAAVHADRLGQAAVPA